MYIYIYVHTHTHTHKLYVIVSNILRTKIRVCIMQRLPNSVPGNPGVRVNISMAAALSPLAPTLWTFIRIQAACCSAVCCTSR